MFFQPVRLISALGGLLIWFGQLLCVAHEFTFFEPVKPPRKLQVMAYHGETGQAPEDTGPALVRCIEDSIEWAELEVRLTRDGQHVIAHSEVLQAGTNAPMVVAEHTLAELKQLDLGSDFAARYAGERILSLTDCFSLAQGRLNLCLHGRQFNPAQLAKEILAAGMQSQVAVFAEPEQLGSVEVAAPGQLALLAKWSSSRGTPAWAASNHLAAVEIDAHEVTLEDCKVFHALGVKVKVSSAGDGDQPAYWGRALAAGADWIQTGLPEEVVAHALWKKFPHRPVQFSLHRGANRYAPENTLPAFDKAVRLGADYIEFDVRTTSDGKYFLLHDERLDGKTDGHGLIANIPANEIEKVSAGVKFARKYAGLRLPTLEDFMNAMAGRVNFYFDAKAIPPSVLVDALQRHEMINRTVVYGSARFLAKLKEINPTVRVLPPLGSMDEIETLARELKPYGVDAEWQILSEELIARCHALGIHVFSDALGRHETVQDYQQAIRWGIDVIQTDHPLRVMRAMELSPAP